MQKRSFLGLMTGLFVLGLVSAASATLTTIGTANYDSDGDGIADIFDLNLIWDDDNNGNSVVWLDYTNGYGTWNTQMSWAAGLNMDGVLTYNLFNGYSVLWDEDWRLPSPGANPRSGFNQTTSEMGHLFYDELGLNGDGVTITSTAELNAANFDHLLASWYWSDTDSGAGYPWGFGTVGGAQYCDLANIPHNGLAVRGGQVSLAPVPEPTTMLLFCTCIAGLAGLRKKKKNV